MLLRPLAAVALTALAPATGIANQGLARFDWFRYQGDDQRPKPGPQQYANPVLQGFYPDPSVLRVGKDYYLVNSTFSWFPGLPIFHSRDLVSWTQIANAIDRPSQLNLAKMSMWQGVYAPDISWHDGQFFLLNTCIGCGGNYVLTASRAAGPWSGPVWLPEVDGIDTSLFFDDDDGTAWIVHNGPPVGRPRYAGHTAIWLQQFDAKALKTVGPRRLLVDSGSRPERKPIWIEGPHIFKKDGIYYLIAAEGGTEEGHSEVIFRSNRVTGPYEAFEGNPILTQRDLPKDRPAPITSTGHASFVRTQNGEWWALFLCVRPYDQAGNFNTGRETCMAPISWQDRWPRITKQGQVLPWTEPRPKLAKGRKPSTPTSGAFTLRDEFTRPTLSPSWIMLRNPNTKWWHISKGALELDPRSVVLGDLGNPSLLARRQQHQYAVATTRLHFEPQAGAEAGMVALQNDEHWYFLAVGREKGKRVVRLRRRSGGDDPIPGTILASAWVPEVRPIELRIIARGSLYDFGWSLDGRVWHSLVSGADGTILSTKKAGGFVGAVVGLYAHAKAVGAAK